MYIAPFQARPEFASEALACWNKLATWSPYCSRTTTNQAAWFAAKLHHEAIHHRSHQPEY